MTTRAWGEAYRTTLVCIDGYQRGVMRGRLFNQSFAAGKTFQCLTEFLQQMEDTLDDMDFPRAYSSVRGFAPKMETEARPPQSQAPTGQEATFAVRVLFRQNASWQGSVTWLEGKREQSFRSALELIFLMNSALMDAENTRAC